MSLAARHHCLMHLSSHIFHSIYFNGTKWHDEQKSIPIFVRFVFVLFLKSASFLVEKKKRMNCNTIKRNYGKGARTNHIRDSMICHKIVHFHFGFSSFFSSFVGAFLFFYSVFSSLNIWCECVRLYCDVIVLFFVKRNIQIQLNTGLNLYVWFATPKRRKKISLCMVFFIVFNKKSTRIPTKLSGNPTF